SHRGARRGGGRQPCRGKSADQNDRQRKGEAEQKRYRRQAEWQGEVRCVDPAEEERGEAISVERATPDPRQEETGGGGSDTQDHAFHETSQQHFIGLPT